MDELLSTPGWKVILFGSPGCGHCKHLHHALESFLREHDYTIQLHYIDCLSEMDFAQAMGIGRLVPYTVLLQDVDIVERYTGNRYEEMIARLDAIFK